MREWFDRTDPAVEAVVDDKLALLVRGSDGNRYNLLHPTIAAVDEDAIERLPVK